MFLCVLLCFCARINCTFHYICKNYSYHDGVYKGLLIGSEESVSFETLEFKLTMSKIPRFEVYPQYQERWRVPPSYYYYDPTISDVDKYEVTIQKKPFFWIRVTRNFDSFKLLDFTMVSFEEQFIEFNLELGYSSNEDFIYGLGERTSPFRLLGNQDYTIFNKNYHFTYPGLNLYGSHPVFFQVNPTNGFTNGLYFLNTNAMDVYLGVHNMRYRSIGGVVDLFILPGTYARDLLEHYFSIIGNPRMIPAWALGFHNCKYGYNSTETLRNVVENYKKFQIPLEAIWSDIDYMDDYKTFTVDPVNYKGLKDFIVNEIHGNNQKYVVIIDPGIKVEKGYKAYDDGMEMDVFIKEYWKDNPMEGKMFCGKSYFPDFESKNSSDYWRDQLQVLYDQVPFDAVWLDQNELSSFCNGFCANYTMNMFDNPPYVPGEKGNHQLFNLTISLSSRQALSLHYNTHNLYPYEEMSTTIEALEEIQNRRTFLVSRSSHAGSGQFGGHWLGDNNGTWEDLKQSIPGLLSFNMFGMPLVGADVGGFYRDTPKELMIRWIELGAFYPFMRDHAHKSVKHQELYSFDKQVREISISMLSRRYSLIPYMYTTFYQYHRYSYPPVAAALWTVLPFPISDHSDFLENDKQFMIGECILVSPVLDPIEKGMQESTLRMFLSSEYRWYNWGGTEMLENGWVEVSVPLDDIMVHIRGGCAVPLHDPMYTVKETIESGLTFLCAFDRSESCVGNIYVDDGDNLEPSKMMYGTLTAFTTSNNNKKDNEEKMSPNNICLGKYTLLRIDRGQKVGTEQKEGYFKSVNLKDIKLLGVSGSIYEVHVFSNSEVSSHPVQRIDQVWWVSGVNLDLYGSNWNVVLCRDEQESGRKNVVLTVILSVVGSLTATCVILCAMACFCVMVVVVIIVWVSSTGDDKNRYRILGRDYDATGKLDDGSDYSSSSSTQRRKKSKSRTSNFDPQVMDGEEDEDDGDSQEEEDEEEEQEKEQEEEEEQRTYESRLINRNDENQI